MTFRAPASELLDKPSTWRVATVDPMALQALVMAVAGLLLLGFLVALIVLKVSQVTALLPVLIALLGFVAGGGYFFRRRRDIILSAFDRGFITRAEVLETHSIYTQRPIRLRYSFGDREIFAKTWLAWGSSHRRLRREGSAWVVIDPARLEYAYLPEELGVPVPPHLAALCPDA